MTISFSSGALRAKLQLEKLTRNKERREGASANLSVSGLIKERNIVITMSELHLSTISLVSLTVWQDVNKHQWVPSQLRSKLVHCTHASLSILSALLSLVFCFDGVLS